MPLLKRKPFPPVEPPQDLKGKELVYQVRFTKEIFCNYHDYLNRMNLYRQRMWTCKMTGKSNLTYEEALVSENRATEKVKEFPKELVTPVLQMIQFSMLPLKELGIMITSKLQETLSEGAELYGRKSDGVHLCKILKVLKVSANITQYEVTWLDEDEKLSESTVLNEQDLIQKKLPFTREVLKSFIRESTYRNVPWVLHDKLAAEHGISSDPPNELKNKISLKDGRIVINKKRNKIEDVMDVTLAELGQHKRKKLVKDAGSDVNEEDQLNKQPIQYPIDDLLVKPCVDDPKFPERPSPSRDFNVPMDCVGDLLMVWDFVSFFKRLLQLSPFSLEDFEKAISHKDSNLVMIVELHAALFRLLMKDRGEYFSATEERKRKITLLTWTEYLCDFVEMINISELRACISTIKRGHYGLLDTSMKLHILRELVDQAIATDILRDELDEYVKQQRELGAAKRGEALEEGKKKREEALEEGKKKREDALEEGKKIREDALEEGKKKIEENGIMKLESGINHIADTHKIDNTRKKFIPSANGNHSTQNGVINHKMTNMVSTPRKHESENSCKDVKSSSKKLGKKLKVDIRLAAGNDADRTPPKRNKDERREFFKRELEKRLIRTKPLGKDRDYNRYWCFKGDGRIFIESSDSKEWGYYNTKEELDTFMSSLNLKGIRERSLHKQLETFYERISWELQKKLKDKSHESANEEAVVRRSTRVRAQPRESPAFIRYANKWKEE